MKTYFCLIIPILCSFYYSSALQSQELTNISKKDLPFTFKKEYAGNETYFTPIDIENDGEDEYLYIIKEEDIAFSMRCYRHILHEPLFQKNFPQGIVTNPPYVFRNEQDILNILVPLKINNTAFLSHFIVANNKAKEIGNYEITKGIDRNKSGEWDGHIKPVAVSDINNDGYLDVVIHDFRPNQFIFAIK